MASCTASLVAPALRVSGARRAGARRASRGPVRVAASSVEEIAGTGDLPAVRLTAKNGDTATAYLFGGVVTSFVKNGRDDDFTVSCLFSYFYLSHGTVEHLNWNHFIRGQQTL